MDDPQLAQMRLDISKQSFADEKETIDELLKHTADVELLNKDITKLSRKMVEQMRKDGGGNSIEAFLYEYGLQTEEGVAIMCLAEALLRIPDKDTADALISDKFEDAEWNKHLGNSDSFFVNASSWGLLLTGSVVNLQGETPYGFLGRAIGRLGEPVIRESLKIAMRIIGKQFVLGEGIKDALKEARIYAKKNYRTSFDILGEGARTDEQAARYLSSYLHALDCIAEESTELEGDTYNLSVKLSALHPRLHLVKHEQLKEELLPKLIQIVEKAWEYNIRISLDAEEAARLDLTLEMFTMLIEHPATSGYHGLGLVVQAYQKRSYMVVEYLAELMKRTHRKMPVRLVKGAYWDSEIKWAQEQGFAGYPVFTRKEHTDVSYLACATKLLEHTELFYPQFATHNARSAASIITLAKKLRLNAGQFEFQRLHGMGEKLHGQFKDTYTSRVYGPVGEHQDLLAYLIRRLMENSANTSFVNLLMDQKTPPEALLGDPIAKTRKQFGAPMVSIPLPEHIYNNRWKNSVGLDIAYTDHYQTLERNLGAFNDTQWKSGPIVACALPKGLETRTLVEPANTERVVGEVTEVTAAVVDDAMAAAQKVFPLWSTLPVDERAKILEKAADLIEQHQVEFIALCMREAGKTWDDGIAEIREAADFCRYYAQRARIIMTEDVRPSPTGESNILSLHARGVIGCISPWNFPLAIFIGQVSAALVTGNCVLAKPAAQTPLIAHKTVQLFIEAGLPEGVLQLIPGAGSTVGNAMVGQQNIAGIVFTGSTATAKRIQQKLTDSDGPIVPFIAETGGLNCMVVDSSALLEQACDDIIASAFGSAGQRCSALRMLYVQDDIADALIHMLKGAMAKLDVAHPWQLYSDVGPVIDTGAKKILDDHIEELHQHATFITSAPIDEATQAQGHFVTPHAFELPNDTMLEEEFFGPILHIVRFKSKELSGLPARINGFGYGLTFGIHSRIQDHIDYFIRHIHVGNIYVNRTMTGAVVGVQPFGGEGLSGTGPKAGGPHYLMRFLHERHVTINTTAIGGNLQLLSQA